MLEPTDVGLAAGRVHGTSGQKQNTTAIERATVAPWLFTEEFHRQAQEIRDELKLMNQKMDRWLAVHRLDQLPSLTNWVGSLSLLKAGLQPVDPEPWFSYHKDPVGSIEKVYIYI